MNMTGDSCVSFAGAFDDDLVLQVLQDLKAGKTVQIPQYDPVKHCR